MKEVRKELSVRLDGWLMIVASSRINLQRDDKTDGDTYV